MADVALIPPPQAGLPVLLPTPVRPQTQVQAAPSAQGVAQLVMAGMNPRTVMASQQNQQLAQLLAGIQKQGQSGEHATAASTAANLLAEALATYSKRKSDQALINDVAQDRTAAGQAALGSIGLGPDGQPVAAQTPAASPQPASTAPNPNASVEDDVRAAYAAAQGDAAPSSPADPSAAAKTSPSGGSLMIGGGADSGSPPGGAQSLNPAAPTSDMGTYDALVNAMMRGTGGGSAPAPTGPAAASSSGAGMQPQISPALQFAAQAQQQNPAQGQGPPQSSPMGVAGAGSPGVKPTSRAQQAFAFLTAQGLNPNAAAGLVGNLQAESGLDPQAYNAAERAGGVAQWRGARLDALKAYARATGGTPDDFQTQLGFMAHELGSSEAPAAQALAQASDPASATAAATAYLRPAGWTPGGNPASVSNWPSRVRNAQLVLASYGGAPSAPQGTAGQGAAPVAQGAPSGMAPVSQGVGQPQVQYGPGPTPREQQVLRQLLTAPDPNLRDQGLAMISAIRERMMTPIEMDARYEASTGDTTYTPKTPGYGQDVTVGAPQGFRAPLPAGMQYDASGVARPVAGMGYADLGSPAPGALLQRAPNGELKTVQIPNAAGSAPEGMAWNAQRGRYVPVPGAQAQTSGAFAPGTVVQTEPGTGRQSVVQAPQYGASQAAEVRGRFYDSDEFKKYSEAQAAYNGLNNVLGKMSNNGVLDTAAIDSYLRGINPGMGARNTTVAMFLNHLGLPQEVQSTISSAVGNGYLTPQTLQQMRQVIQGYAQGHYQVAKQRMDADQAWANARGMGDLGESLTPPATPGIQANPAALVASARSALQRGANPAAVRQRLQQMGVDPRQAGL